MAEQSLLPKYPGINKKSVKTFFFERPKPNPFIFEIVKVLILPSWYPSKNAPFDGIFIQEQAEALAKAGLEIAVLHGDMKAAHLLAGNTLSMTIENGVQVFRKSGFALPKANLSLVQRWAKNQKDLFDSYVAKNGQPDIIHAHSFIAGHLGKYIKAISGVPLLLTEHHSELLQETPNQRYRAFAKDCYASCDRIIAVSDALGKAIQGLSDTEVVVIPNLVDTNIFYPTTESRPKNNQLNLLAVGSFDENKGFLHLIECLPMLLKHQPNLNIHLDLFGEGPLREKFEARVKALKLEKNVQLHPATSKERLADYYRAADVFCLPSRFETFGIVLIEALACGTPVVASGLGGPQEIINEQNGLHVPFGQSDALAHAIYEIYTSEKKHSSQQLALATKERYGTAAIVKRIVHCYESMLNSEA